MAHQSHMKTVLDTVAAIAEQNNGEACADAVSNALMAQTRQQHKNILNTLSQLYGQGRLQRPRQGVYAPAVPSQKTDKRGAMWRVLRMRKRVTVEDMMTMADAGKDYAREWLSMLAARDVVRKIQEPGKTAVWILVKDSVEMPQDEEKAARLRDIRARKKAELSDRIEGIEKELKKVKETIAEL